MMTYSKEDILRILVINPGSTSTKIAVFENEDCIFDRTLRHTNEELSGFDSIAAQKDFRKKMILDFLKEKDFNLKSLHVCVGRGGLIKPVSGGTYEVNDAMVRDLISGVQGQHASNLGGLLAREIGDEAGIPSFIVDPVSVDEMEPVARITGVQGIERTAISHPLNQKAMARRYAAECGRSYDELDLIVVHMGGGVSCGAHHNGRIIDVYNAFDGDGAFSPERAGGLPSGPLVKLCFSGKYSEEEVRKMLIGGGGLNSYLQCSDMQKCEEMMRNGDKKAELVIDAFIYQISKNIGSMAAVLKGHVDRIILTGGIAYEDYITDGIKERVSFIAPVTVYKGEDELLSLAEGAIRVMRNEEEAKVYA